MAAASMFDPVIVGFIGFSSNMLRGNVGKALAFFYIGVLLTVGIATIVLAINWLIGGAVLG